MNEVDWIVEGPFHDDADVVMVDGRFWCQRIDVAEVLQEIEDALFSDTDPPASW